MTSSVPLLPSEPTPGAVREAVLYMLASMGWEEAESDLPGGEYVAFGPGGWHRISVDEMVELHGSVPLEEVPLLLTCTEPIHRNRYVLRKGWSYWVMVVLPYMAKRLELGL